MRGVNPIEAGSINTMPHRDTVAGVAEFKSGTSNINLMVEGIAMRSPFVKKSILFYRV
jgi:hypothetical protein